MFVSERLNEILKLIEEKGKVEVNHLSNLFKVSKDLIRKDLSKLEKYGNFISYSKKGRYACIYVDENRIDSIVADLKKKKFVKKIEISEMSDLHLSFENFENKLDNTR